MTKFFLLALAALFFFLPSQQASAAITPLAISILPPVQFPPSDWDVTGLRASVLWGKHRDVYGIDLGIGGNITTGQFNGLALAGGFNLTQGRSTIILGQIAGITNMNMEQTTVVGLQASVVANYNKAESSIYGIALAAANISPNTTVNGFELGVYNSARTVNGFQIGLINVTENLHGLQIGLANFNHNGLFKFAPILNVGF